MTELLIATGSSYVRLARVGEGWEIEEHLKGFAARCLSASREASTKILVGTQGEGLQRSLDGGQTWDSPELPERDVFSVAISPADGSMYVGTEPSRLFKSNDDGDTWNELTALQDIPSRPQWSFPPRPWTSHVRWIAPNPTDPDLLLVGIELGGLMVSQDAGVTWSDHKSGAQRDVHSLAWHPIDTRRAYETGGGGAAWSLDGGQTWEPVDSGRDRHYTWALAPDPLDPDRWYVSASPGPSHAHGGASRSAQARIYRWQGEGPWEALTEGLPDPLPDMPYALAAKEGEMYAGLSDGTIYTSGDQGDSWVPLKGIAGKISGIVAMLAL